MPLATVGCSTHDDRKCLNACKPFDSPYVKEDGNKNNNNTRRIRRNNVPRSTPRERLTTYTRAHQCLCTRSKNI